VAENNKVCLSFGHWRTNFAISSKKPISSMRSASSNTKVVTACNYPLTGIACVTRIYSDLATLECTPQGLKLIDKVEGLTHTELEGLLGLSVQACDS
jgi:acyl CoA:acetate/3-ketoacid CoA transferase beta subunit